MKSFSDASELYAVERRARHAEREGFRISELQLSPTQVVPWHYHNNIHDTFYVLSGRIRVHVQDPKDSVELGPGDTYKVEAGRPHLVRNVGDGSATFLILQGIGEYDYVPATVGDDDNDTTRVGQQEQGPKYVTGEPPKPFSRPVSE